MLRDIGRGPGYAVRLDSGDLGALAVRARQILDDADLPDTGILVSGGLDEYRIDDLVRARAPIDAFAVGTKVGVSADAPYLDSAYKIVEYEGRPLMKLSAAKATAPGAKQVFRSPCCVDVLALSDEPHPAGAEPLLHTVMSGGQRIHPPQSLAKARKALQADLEQLPDYARRIREPVAPPVTPSGQLVELTSRCADRLAEAAALRRRAG